MNKIGILYRAFSHDIMAATFVFQNNETVAILVYQTSPVGDKLFSLPFVSVNLHVSWPRE